ncbi:hypothetical protein H1C71_010190 [Ictidomys tridecemlineatus]|nr:hypothetical protein H1C71_010190 [Ictidomys tridecemlineatus]
MRAETGPTSLGAPETDGHVGDHHFHPTRGWDPSPCGIPEWPSGMSRSGVVSSASFSYAAPSPYPGSQPGLQLGTSGSDILFGSSRGSSSQPQTLGRLQE